MGYCMRNLIILIFLTICSSFARAANVNDIAVSCPATLVSNNKPLELDMYKGKVVYLDFWATWCPPCKKSMPFLNSLRNELVDQGFEIIAINVDEDSEDAYKLLQKRPVDYVIAMDPSGNCPKEYDVTAMPSAYLIDRNGVMRYVHLGFRKNDEKEIYSRIKELLADNEGS